ncbi:heptaprenyl diphosphate synthase component 1 [Bacillus sp. AK031]
MKQLDCFHLEASIKHYVEEKLSYSYLQKYIDSPQIDEDRISFLALPFTRGGHGMNEKELIQLISTVMLIQIGLDTHEKVTNSSSDSLKERQLTVLAGVYFSGQYYKILSELENVELINHLAQAIKTVNESKISLYKQEFQNMGEVMESVKAIESTLIASFLGHYGTGRKIELAKETLFLRRLLSEETLLDQNIPTPLLSAMKAIVLFSTKEESRMAFNHKEVLGRIMTHYITESKDKISDMLRDSSFDGLLIENRIGELLEQARPYTKIFAEEG